MQQSWPKATLMPAAHLRHAGHAAALRVGVVAALQRDVDQRIGDGVDAGLGDQRQQLGDVVVVHGVHGGQVRAGDAALQARAAASRRPAPRCGATCGSSVSSQCMSTSRPRFGGDLAERLQAARPVRHGALEMRDAADHVDALVERAVEVLRGVGRAEIAVLREGDELQVDVGRDLASCTSSSASTAVSRSSQMSTWLRMASRPFETARSQ